MICGGERAIRSPNLPARISQAFESLLEGIVSYQAVFDSRENSNLTGDVTSWTRCLSGADGQ